MPNQITLTQSTEFTTETQCIYVRDLSFLVKLPDCRIFQPTQSSTLKLFFQISIFSLQQPLMPKEQPQSDQKHQNAEEVCLKMVERQNIEDRQREEEQRNWHLQNRQH